MIKIAKKVKNELTICIVVISIYISLTDPEDLVSKLSGPSGIGLKECYYYKQKDLLKL